jgi:hypothetical protein
MESRFATSPNAEFFNKIGEKPPSCGLSAFVRFRLEERTFRFKAKGKL